MSIYERMAADPTAWQHCTTCTTLGDHLHHVDTMHLFNLDNIGHAGRYAGHTPDRKAIYIGSTKTIPVRVERVAIRTY